MIWFLALLFVVLVVFGFVVWRSARSLAVRARRLGAYSPAVSGPAVVHASAPARIVSTRMRSGDGVARRPVSVPVNALPVGDSGELQVTDGGLLFGAGAGGRLLPHASIVDLSLVQSVADELAHKGKTLLSVTLDVDGGPLELVFAIDASRVTAERVRREAHVRGGRVQAVLAEVLSRRGMPGSP